jgi:outer membrane protein OmpA-like peptidoglycan-associated protein
MRGIAFKPGLHRQRGSAMIEFTLIGPVLTLIGCGILQYAMLFNAKNMVNHASFMAARAGSMGNANLETVRSAYTRALIPLYGGGRDSAELAQAYARAGADTAVGLKLELLNPTKESFDDWSDPALQARYGKRAIPNTALAFKDPGIVKGGSGQNIQDANLIKLKITHGYELKVPLMANLIKFALTTLDAGTDPFVTAMYTQGRVPIVTQVTLQMQSDAVEPGNAVLMPPGDGDPGGPHDPGPSGPPVTPPVCTTGCPTTPTQPGTPEPGCKSDASTTLASDLLFDFDSSTLKPAASQYLDELIDSAKGVDFDSVKLTGYTDPIGDPGYNDQLSLARAQAVRNYLLSHGFPDKPVSLEGKGSQDLVKPLAECSGSLDEQKVCLAPNRRVVIVLQGVKS